MPSVTQSSRTLSEAITKKGRCSVFHQRPFDVFATTGCCRVFASGQWVIYRVFRKCGEKSKLAERTPIFANKTAGRKVSNLGSGRQVSGFHLTSECMLNMASTCLALKAIIGCQLATRRI